MRERDADRGRQGGERVRAREDLRWDVREEDDWRNSGGACDATARPSSADAGSQD